MSKHEFSFFLSVNTWTHISSLNMSISTTQSASQLFCKTTRHYLIQRNDSKLHRASTPSQQRINSSSLMQQFIESLLKNKNEPIAETKYSGKRKRVSPQLAPSSPKLSTSNELRILLHVTEQKYQKEAYPTSFHPPSFREQQTEDRLKMEERPKVPHIDENILATTSFKFYSTQVVSSQTPSSLLRPFASRHSSLSQEDSHVTFSHLLSVERRCAEEEDPLKTHDKDEEYKEVTSNASKPTGALKEERKSPSVSIIDEATGLPCDCSICTHPRHYSKW